MAKMLTNYILKVAHKSYRNITISQGLKSLGSPIYVPSVLLAFLGAPPPKFEPGERNRLEMG